MSIYRYVPPFAMLRAFEVFGRLGGIRRTAQHLAVDHSAISRQLKSLEAWAGTSLIDRSSSDIHLTPDGRAYHARISVAMREIADATAVFKERNSSKLMLWSAPGFALHWLAPNLSSFRSLHPNIDLELRPSDRPPSFATNEADADIRYERDGLAEIGCDLKTVEIARPEVFPVASPEYISRMGVDVDNAEELLRYHLLHEETDADWRDWLEAQGFEPPERIEGPRLWHAHITLQAAIRGQGIAICNPLLLGDTIEKGVLVPIQPRSGTFKPVMPGGYYLVGRSDRWTSFSLARFRKWMIDACKIYA